jgi:hypothetical protein
MCVCVSVCSTLEGMKEEGHIFSFLVSEHHQGMKNEGTLCGWSSQVSDANTWRHDYHHNGIQYNDTQIYNQNAKLSITIKI